MTTPSKPRPPVAVEGFDLTRMQHINEHPDVARLLGQKATLRQQLSTIADEVRGLRQQLHDVSSDEAFIAAINRRTLQDQIDEREREGAAIEEQLQHLATEIERVKAPLREQVSILRTQESAAVLAQFVSALEALHQASEAYQACCHRNYRLLQSWILPQEWLDPWLPSRVATARKHLERLQQEIMRLND